MWIIHLINHKSMQNCIIWGFHSEIYSMRLSIESSNIYLIYLICKVYVICIFVFKSIPFLWFNLSTKVWKKKQFYMLTVVFRFGGNEEAVCQWISINKCNIAKYNDRKEKLFMILHGCNRMNIKT